LGYIAGHDLDNGDENFAPSKLVITDIRAGMEVTNVTPHELNMMFNIRNSTKTTKEDVDKYIKKVFEGLKYDLILQQTSYPFVTDKKSFIVQELQKVIQEETGIKPKLSTAGGTSDGRHIPLI